MQVFILTQIGTGIGALVTILLIIAFAIVVFLACRELVTWYWKVNKIVQNQDEQTSLMRQLLNEVKERKDVLK